MTALQSPPGAREIPAASPMQTCLVQNSGTGSTGHLFGFNSSGDRIVQAGLGPLPTSREGSTLFCPGEASMAGVLAELFSP